MGFYIPRKLKFKAWNTESKLLMRLNSIECVKGELTKRNHILLQFTDMTDKHHEELYEMDVVLIGTEKFVIMWESNPAGWRIARLADPQSSEVFVREQAQTVIRLCSYFESVKE
ncbi:MAG TPA: hypothetical protein VGK59_08620 [Ohtaekwangia sp.]